MASKNRYGLNSPLQKVMTLEEVSQYLHIHPFTVYRLLKGGEIPAFRIGSDWRFNIEAIDV
jgi:excisionase family DNA binding protein